MGNSIYRLRTKFLFIQYTYLLVTWILLNVDILEKSPWMLGLMSIWNIVSYAYLFYIEIKYAPEIHPFTLLALACIQYIGINGLTYSNKIIGGDHIFFCGNDVSGILVIGIWYLSLQHILSFTSYYKILNINRKNLKTPFFYYISNNVIPYRKWAIKIYKYIWIIRILDILVNLNAYSSFLWNITNNAQLIPLTLLIFSVLKSPKDKKNMRLYWAITLVEIVRVLGVGSKQSIIMNLIPYVLYLLIGYKNHIVRFDKNLILALGGIGFFVLFVVFPYVSVFRDIANRQKISWDKVEITEALSEYGDYILGTGHYAQSQDDNKSTDYLADRAGAISCNAWAIDHAQRKGNEIKYLAFNAISLVPRFIWPNKPPNITGSMLYHIAHNDPQWEIKSLVEYKNGKSQTFVSAGFIGGCYFALGIFGAIFFPWFAGWFICKFWLFLRDKISYNIIAIWAFYTIINVMITDFEGFDDCGIIFYFFSIIYVIIIKYIFPLNKYKTLYCNNLT